MAKDVIIKIWCDRHMDMDEQRVEGIEQPVTLGGRTVTVDLCEPCIKEFITPLAQLIERYGVVPTSGPTMPQPRRGRDRKATDRGAECLWCSLDFSATTGGGMMRHLKIVHGYANAQEAFGTICPVCGQPEVLMMMAHMNKHHGEYGFNHSAQALVWARDHGDPHGVYAASVGRKPSLNPQHTG